MRRLLVLLLSRFEMLFDYLVVIETPSIVYKLHLFHGSNVIYRSAEIRLQVDVVDDT